MAVSLCTPLAAALGHSRRSLHLLALIACSPCPRPLRARASAHAHGRRLLVKNKKNKEIPADNSNRMINEIQYFGGAGKMTRE